MGVHLHQRIANVDFLVTFPPGLVPRAPGVIETTFACGDRAGSDAIHVTLAAGEMPELDAWHALVSAGDAWCIRRQGVHRCMCLGKPLAGGPTGRIACWQLDANRATVYCAPQRLAGGRDSAEIFNPAAYPIDQLLLIYFLACRRGILIHAAGIADDGRALIFPGVSGAGKSTLARQFLGRDRSVLLSDDRIIVREIDGRPMAFGTPWPGEAGVAVNAGAPLAAILFPARGGDTRIRELSSQAALDRLLPAASMLWFELELLSGQLETCERLLRDVPAFELSWSPGTGVVEELQEFVRRI
jgi:hypothetical protein